MLGAMEKTLNAQILPETGHTVREYLASILDCLKAIYESEEGNAGAAEIVSTVEKLQPVSFHWGVIVGKSDTFLSAVSPVCR